MPETPAHKPRKRVWGHEVKWTLKGLTPTCTATFEPIFEQPETDFTSDEDAAAGLNVVQYGVKTEGAKIGVMVPRAGEDPCPVLDELVRCAADNEKLRTGPLAVSAPAPCVMNVPVLAVKRLPWTGGRGAPLVANFELKNAGGTVTPAE